MVILWDSEEWSDTDPGQRHRGSTSDSIHLHVFPLHKREGQHGVALMVCVCVCVFQSSGISFFSRCVSESGGVSDFNSRDHPLVRLALLQHVSTQRGDPTQPAGPHLQRVHRQHVPVPTVLPGEIKDKKWTSSLRSYSNQNLCCPLSSGYQKYSHSYLHTPSCTAINSVINQNQEQVQHNNI